MKTKKKRRSVVQKPVSVWCANGLCEGEVFQADPGTKELRVVTPVDPAYKMAIYTITDKITHAGEYVAIFLRGVLR